MKQFNFTVIFGDFLTSTELHMLQNTYFWLTWEHNDLWYRYHFRFCPETLTTHFCSSTNIVMRRDAVKLYDESLWEPSGFQTAQQPLSLVLPGFMVMDHDDTNTAWIPSTTRLSVKSETKLHHRKMTSTHGGAWNANRGSDILPASAFYSGEATKARRTHTDLKLDGDVRPSIHTWPTVFGNIIRQLAPPHLPHPRTEQNHFKGKRPTLGYR